MRSRPTREDLLDALKKFTTGELAIEHFMLEFDELSKLGVSSTLREPERKRFSQLWRFVDAYTPSYKEPTTARGKLKRLGREFFKGESEAGADAVRNKAAELQRVMLSEV